MGKWGWSLIKADQKPHVITVLTIRCVDLTRRFPGMITGD